MRAIVLALAAMLIVAGPVEAAFHSYTTIKGSKQGQLKGASSRHGAHHGKVKTVFTRHVRRRPPG